MVHQKSRVISNDDLQPDRLGWIIENNALQYPNNIAWIDWDKNESISYAQLLSDTNTIIERLRAKNLKSGQPVCLVLTHSRYFFPLLVASIELGLLLVPIEEDKNEIQSTLRNLRPRLVIYTSEWSLTKDDILTRTEVLSIQEFIAGPEVTSSIDFTDPKFAYSLNDTPSLLIKTSGTTGVSKYVELSEKNLVWNAYALQRRFAVNKEDRILCTLPWSHMNAIMLTGCLPLVAGAAVIYRNITRSRDPIGDIEATKANIVSLTPTLISFLIKRQNPEQDLSSVRWAFCGAAPLTPSLWKAGEEKLKCIIYQGYGLSETTCWITASQSDRDENYSNVGNLLIGEIKINIKKGIQLITQVESISDLPYSIGEIQYRGPLLMSGYRFTNKNQTQKLKEDDFFATGDIGYIDENDSLHIVGRIKEIIIRSGINIIPETIDSEVIMHSAILDSKTVGIVDELLGEQVVTAYCIKPGVELSEIELRRFLNDRLPRQLIPNRLVQVANLPMTRVGKIALKTLRELVNGDYAQRAFQAINTWRFKRAHSPEPEKIIETFQKNILMGRPIPLLAYWGIGERDKVCDIDKQALLRFKMLVDELGTCEKANAMLTLIFTDVHALINGKPKQRIDAYLSGIESLCDESGFNFIRSSTLWQKANLDIDSIIEKAASISLSELLEQYPISDNIIQKLTSSAQRHVENGDSQEGLKRYLLACFIERNFFAQEYPNSVFVSYNETDMNILTPPLPTFPVTSYQNGTAVKPWFANQDSLLR